MRSEADIEYGKRIAAAMRAAEKKIAGIKLLVEHLPNAKQTFRNMDEALAKTSKRSRGERGKLNGALLLEEVAVDAVKYLKRQYADEGLPTFDAWEKARKNVGKVIGVSPATLADWQRGKSKRERRKPLEKRRHRVRKAKKPILNSY